jgi:hypothetical protein
MLHFIILLFAQLQNFEGNDMGGNQVISRQPVMLPLSRPSTSVMPPPPVYSSSRGQCSAPILCYLEMVFFLIRSSVWCYLNLYGEERNAYDIHELLTFICIFRAARIIILPVILCELV